MNTTTQSDYETLNAGHVWEFIKYGDMDSVEIWYDKKTRMRDI